MKHIQRLVSLAIFFGTSLFAQSTFALQFTYTSQALEFKQGYLGGQPDEYIGTYDPPSPIFNISFVGTANGLTTKLLFGDVTVSEHENLYQIDDIPATNSSRITLNNDGSIASWSFSLGIVKTTPQTSDNPPNRAAWLFQSSYGANTCNCDLYKKSSDIYTPRPYYTWQYVNRVGVLYVGENSLSNWSVENTEVPEPMSYLLLFSGLTVIGLTRLRNVTTKHNRTYK